MTEVTPQDFDLDAWLEDAERPARSVTVYQRAGLIADLDALAEQIENAETEESATQIYERGLSEESDVQRLTREYATLARKFHDSALTITVQGHDEAEKVEFAKANPDAGPSGLVWVVIADAIQSPKFTPEQVKRLADKVGETQFSRVLVAYHQASTEIPAVSADFLPKPSTPDDGGE